MLGLCAGLYILNWCDEMRMNDYSKQSLCDIAFLYIKKKILSGNLKSGDKLIESDLSLELGISRAPVREALRELNVHGFIAFSPRKGNRGLEMTQEEILEVFEIRISLELQILRILVEQKMLSENDFAELSALTGKMLESEHQNIPEDERIYRLNSLDIAFHRYLWNASGSKRRAQYLEDLFFQLLIAMNKDVVSLGTFEEKAREHALITDALRSGNLKKVNGQFQDHLKEYVAAFFTGIKNGVS